MFSAANVRLSERIAIVRPSDDYVNNLAREIPTLYRQSPIVAANVLRTVLNHQYRQGVDDMAKEVVDNHEQTTLGHLGKPERDPNAVRGVTIGSVWQLAGKLRKERST